jgi:hypothetical protein
MWLKERAVREQATNICASLDLILLIELLFNSDAPKFDRLAITARTAPDRT